ncbi:hypothetical protein HPB51_001688 [Rhipicephalus microplus]|uniref:Retrotransposon gag domain-containing protein n=1 Tax=Rhipicephalus microplus TaxID=6941 RepID=A0A9J6E5K7_RHIMP|nr:hypothetical protein HPB51_001688 [Rhipicephalus microplus]
MVLQPVPQHAVMTCDAIRSQMPLVTRTNTYTPSPPPQPYTPLPRPPLQSRPMVYQESQTQNNNLGVSLLERPPVILPTRASMFYAVWSTISFTYVASCNKWSEEDKLRNLFFFLEDSTQTWYENQETSLTTWDTFKRRLASTFPHAKGQPYSPLPIRLTFGGRQIDARYALLQTAPPTTLRRALRISPLQPLFRKTATPTRSRRRHCFELRRKGHQPFGSVGFSARDCFCAELIDERTRRR